MTTSTLAMVMAECRNHFPIACTAGLMRLESGVLRLPETLPDCRYVYLSGGTQEDLWEASRTLDGGLLLARDGQAPRDEAFCGRVFCLRPPLNFLSLAEEAEAYRNKAPVGPFLSESFGGYSYTRASGSGGRPLAWQDALRPQLNAYRRMFDDLEEWPWP